jgi:hypothetical protein
MLVLEFSTNNKECSAKQLVPEKRKRNNGTVVLNNHNKKYSYRPSAEYEKYLLQVGHK